MERKAREYTLLEDYHNALVNDFLDDLTTKYDNDPKWTLERIVEKWKNKKYQGRIKK